MLKLKQWKSSVTSGKKGKNAVDNVKTLSEFHEFYCKLKDMKRGKRMALTASNVSISHHRRLDTRPQRIMGNERLMQGTAAFAL